MGAPPPVSAELRQKQTLEKRERELRRLQEEVEREARETEAAEARAAAVKAQKEKEKEREKEQKEKERRMSVQRRELEQRLVANGPYVMGRSLTIGDIPVGLVVNRWFSVDFQKPAFKAVAAYYERLSERPGFKAHGRNGVP